MSPLATSQRASRLSMFCAGIVLVLMASQALPLDTQHRLTQYRMSTWRVGDGLPHNIVLSIIQNPERFVWIGTLDGLTRFDGNRFQVFTQGNTPQLHNNYIRTLCIDRSGRLWIGTQGGGLTCLDGDRFVSYGLGEGLPDMKIKAIAEDRRGTIWVGTENGLARFVNGRFEAFTTAQGMPGNFITSIVSDANGELWIGSLGGGLSRVTLTPAITFHTVEDFPSPDVWSLLIDRQGQIWAGTIGEGLICLSGDSIRTYTTRNGLPSNKVYCLLEDRDGSIWVGTDGGGLVRLFAGRMEVLTTDGGLPSNYVYSLQEDAEGGLWVGTAGGLCRLSDTPIVTFSSREGLPNDQVREAYEDRSGTIWVGTREGMSSVRQDRIVPLPSRETLAGIDIYSVSTDRQDRVWAGTADRGAFCLQGDHRGAYTTGNGLPDNTVYSVLTTQDGSVWFGTRTGLTRFDGKTMHSVPLSESRKVMPIYWMAEDGEGTLWVATGGGGLVAVNGKRRTLYGMDNGLPSNNINVLYIDADGVIWIGSDRGLSRMESGRIFSFGQNSGLPEESIVDIQEDDAGNLWLASSRGILRVKRVDLETYLEKRTQAVTVVTYGESDGMRSRICTGTFRSARHSGGQRVLWFPTLDGLVRISRRDLRPDPPLPVVLVEKILVDGAVVNAGPAPVPRRLEIQPGAGRFEFRFTAPTFDYPDRVRFRYRLEGFDRGWVDAGTARMVQYTNLAPGTYTFRVIAANKDGVWSRSQAALVLVLRPFFYQTRWFYGVSIALILLVGLVGHRLRVRQLRIREKVLQQQVDNRTRELKVALEDTQRAHSELGRAHIQLRQAKSLLEEKNQHILDSIRYARRIQSAILPVDERLRDAFTDYFVIFRPREMVSGDFYWFSEVNDLKVVAVVDCTGHGVPGALLATIGNMLLNEIVNENGVTRPEDILAQLNRGVRSVLRQQGGSAETTDGMDVSMCVIDPAESRLHFSGARRPLYLQSQGRLVEIKGDRKSIGGRQRELERVFTEHTEIIHPGDFIYLTTDGIADQNDPAGRKFGSRRLKSLLEEISGLAVTDQYETLVARLESHQGTEEQRDDITILGIRF